MNKLNQIMTTTTTTTSNSSQCRALCLTPPMMIGGGGGGDGNMLDKDGLNPCLATGRHNTVHIQIEMNTMNAANKA